MFTRCYEAEGKILSAAGATINSFEIEFYIHSFRRPSHPIVMEFAEAQAEEMLRRKIGECDEIVIEKIKRVE